MVLAPIQIAGTGDGDALGHGIEASLALKFLLKGFTSRFQQGDIGLAVLDHFLLEMEGHITTNLVSVPTGPLSFWPSCHRDRKTPNRGSGPRTVDGPGY